PPGRIERASKNCQARSRRKRPASDYHASLNHSGGINYDDADARHLFSGSDVEFSVNGRAAAFDAGERKSVSAAEAAGPIDAQSDSTRRESSDTESAVGADLREILPSPHSAAPCRPLSLLGAARTGRNHKPRKLRGERGVIGAFNYYDARDRRPAMN